MTARPKRKAKDIAAGEIVEDLLALGTGTTGKIRIEAGPASSARSRLLVRGLNVEAEKEKVSLTLDRDLIDAIRKSAGPKRLSSTVNELLIQAVETAQLRTLVETLEEEEGPASAETYQELLKEWFGDES